MSPRAPVDDFHHPGHLGQDEEEDRTAAPLPTVASPSSTLTINFEKKKKSKQQRRRAAPDGGHPSSRTARQSPRKIRRDREYRKLKGLVPTIRQTPTVCKVDIVNQAASYIHTLHEQLLQKLAMGGGHLSGQLAASGVDPSSAVRAISADLGRGDHTSVHQLVQTLFGQMSGGQQSLEASNNNNNNTTQQPQQPSSKSSLN